jgi:NAD(P)-dependent dehydrogenase (short-subunit alcohol dehydrogenase family)
MGGRLVGKVAIVTGAASGLGAAIAELFAREGAGLVLVDIAEDRLADTVAALSPGHVAVAGDVSDERTARRAVEAAGRLADGRIDILVNNAGIDPLEATDVTSTPIATWDRVIAINLRSAFLFSHAVLPIMQRHGEGALVHTSSSYGLRAGQRETAYAVSKYALVQLSNCIALDYAKDGIRSNCICPGIMESVMRDRAEDMSAAALAARSAAARATIPLGREASYASVAQAALFLADSATSGNITGSALPVDGGSTI